MSSSIGRRQEPVIYGVCACAHTIHMYFCLYFQHLQPIPFCFEAAVIYGSLVDRSLTKAKTSSFLTLILCLFHPFYGFLVFYESTLTLVPGGPQETTIPWFVVDNLSQLVQLLHVSSKFRWTDIMQMFSLLLLFDFHLLLPRCAHCKNCRRHAILE